MGRMAEASPRRKARIAGGFYWNIFFAARWLYIGKPRLQQIPESC